MWSEIANTIRVHEPSQDIVDWARFNLEMTNPDYLKKQRLGFWTGKTPKDIRLYEWDGDTLVLPFGTLRDVWPMIGKDKVVVDCQGAPAKVDYRADMKLYDYQDKAVFGTIEAKNGILQSPAGSGKTQMALAIIARLGMRALWVTHTHELLRQSRDRALQYFDKDLIGTIEEGKACIGKGVTFATVQTLSKMDLSLHRDTWNVVIIDECHRVSGSPTAVTMFYRVLNGLNARYKIGLSATVHRSDGMIAATYALLGRVMVRVPDEAVLEKIMRVGIFPMRLETEPSLEYLNTDGTICYAKFINYLCENEERNHAISLALRGSMGHPTLILSDRLEHLQTLMESLPTSMKEQAVFINGKMTSKAQRELRDKAVEQMRSGEKLYLFATYSLAKEGLDIPRLDRLYLTTPQSDYAVVTQSIGRIARTFEWKRTPIAYDFVDDLPITVCAYKKRCTIYRKNKCYFVENEKR